MGEGREKMFDEIHFSYRLEDDEDLGEDSDSGGESGKSPAPSPRKQHPSLPEMSRFNFKSPLYDFSSLSGKQLSKKGLSKYYQGKSQSFTSLSDVKSMEEMSKKEEVPYSRKIKPCKSYVGLDQAHVTVVPSPSDARDRSASKKTHPSMASCASSMTRGGGGGGFLGREGRPPSFPAHKHALNGR